MIKSTPVAYDSLITVIGLIASRIGTGSKQVGLRASIREVGGLFSLPGQGEGMGGVARPRGMEKPPGGGLAVDDVLIVRS